MQCLQPPPRYNYAGDEAPSLSWDNPVGHPPSGGHTWCWITAYVSINEFNNHGMLRMVCSGELREGLMASCITRTRSQALEVVRSP